MQASRTIAELVEENEQLHNIVRLFMVLHKVALEIDRLPEERTVVLRAKYARKLPEVYRQAVQISGRK